MRAYWGGMLAEGATSFWEAYDPRWSKAHSHATLQADGRTGYFVRLARGWSSRPVAWLLEEMVGIKPLASTYRNVQIRPDLLGLTWARGAVATPHGPGVHAEVLLPAGCGPAMAGWCAVKVLSKPSSCSYGSRDRERFSSQQIGVALQSRSMLLGLVKGHVCRFGLVSVVHKPQLSLTELGHFESLNIHGGQ